MTHPQPSPIVDEVALPVGCKMHSHSRYASDLDCTRCGLGEGDACREYFAISDASIAAKKAAAALVSPPKAGEGEPVAWTDKNGLEFLARGYGIDVSAEKGAMGRNTPLYATQQPRVDGVRVTDEMVNASLRGWYSTDYNPASLSPGVLEYHRSKARAALEAALASHAPAIGETQPGLSATDETRAAVIEECARVADEYGSQASCKSSRDPDVMMQSAAAENAADDIAAAIRALANPGDGE